MYPRQEMRERLAGARLVALLKDNLGVNIRPIACGEVLRKLVAKAALDRHLEWVCVKADAKKDFNAVHREAAFEAVERDFPELWAWIDLCYVVEANLGFRLGSALGLVVLERVQERHPGVIVFAYLDDTFLMGPPVVAAAAYEVYMKEAEAIGLTIQPLKSSVYSPEGDTSCFREGRPGVQGRMDIIDVLGVPVGEADKVAMEMLKKVEELCAIFQTLNKLGHAQAQGLLLRFCAHPRLGVLVVVCGGVVAVSALSVISLP
eukprot:gene34007-biopygen1510